MDVGADEARRAGAAADHRAAVAPGRGRGGPETVLVLAVDDGRELLEALRTLWDLAVVVVSIRRIGEGGGPGSAPTLPLR